MIHIIEGRIGSGKTYWCVNYILRQFYDWDERFFSYFPKREIPSIITNIRGLNIGSVIDLNDLLNKAGSLENLFYIDSVSYVLRYEVFRNSIVMIDEAQSPRFFHRLYKNPSVMLFFQLHRHFGAEVFLTTQDVKTLCPDLRELPEYHLRCVRQSLQLGRFFTYRKYYDTEAGATSRIKRDKKVFDMYQSVETGIVHRHVSSALMRYVYLIVVCLILFFVGGYFMKVHFFGGGLVSANIVKKSPVKKNVSIVQSSIPVYNSPSVSSGLTIAQSSLVLTDNLPFLISHGGRLSVEVRNKENVLQEVEYNGYKYYFKNSIFVYKKRLVSDEAHAQERNKAQSFP